MEPASHPSTLLSLSPLTLQDARAFPSSPHPLCPKHYTSTYLLLPHFAPHGTLWLAFQPPSPPALPFWAPRHLKIFSSPCSFPGCARSGLAQALLICLLICKQPFPAEEQATCGAQAHVIPNRAKKHFSSLFRHTHRAWFQPGCLSTVPLETSDLDVQGWVPTFLASPLFKNSPETIR